MKAIFERLAALAFNKLYFLLKNRESVEFSREEIRFFRTSFSQFGEDLAVFRWAKEFGIEKGKYLDVGAFHPVLLSNTLLLHRSGWEGVNIDMNPDKIATFDLLRPQDDNICCAVSAEPKRYVIERAGSPAEHLRELLSDEQIESGLRVVLSQTIKEALKNTCLDGQSVDYVNIDCEGFDFQVLQQIDFADFRPAILTIEALNMVEQEKICQFLSEKRYRLSEKIHWTLLFTDADRKHNLTYLMSPGRSA